MIESDDGSYGIADYKTSEAKDEQAAFYSRQLGAYAYALEHPAPRALGLSPISRMGLFVVTPDRFEPTSSNEMVFVNKTAWMDVRRDDEAFLALLGEVVEAARFSAAPAIGGGLRDVQLSEEDGRVLGALGMPALFA